MISASHNPMPDNGIKLFSRGGHKLPDAVEAAIERTVVSGASAGHRPTGAGIGRVRDLPDAADDYVAAPPRRTVDQPLTGLTRRRRLRPRRRRGDRARGLPPGRRHGARHRRRARRLEHQRRHRLHPPRAARSRPSGPRAPTSGIAHDGDADRCLAVTADGDVVDGDAILAVCALALHERGALKDDTVVATVMSNLGFHHTMRDAGIAVQTTAVGDRYVLEALRARGLSLGRRAERPPGLPRPRHHRRRAAHRAGPAVPDGRDRRLAGRAGLGGAAAAADPDQRAGDRPAARSPESDEVAEAVNAVEAELGDTGRVLLRPSGTEQLVRVMVEAPTQEQADEVAAAARRGRRRRRLSRRPRAARPDGVTATGRGRQPDG